MFRTDHYQALLKEMANYPQAPTLLVVSKYVPIEDLIVAFGAGVRDFAESRAQELLLKAAAMQIQTEPIRWHFIGHLQHNKFNKILPLIDTLHSVDSVTQAERLAEYFQKHSRFTPLNAFIEINLSGAEQKSGFKVGDEAGIRQCADVLKSCPQINWKGFMGMASANVSDNQLDLEFTELTQIRERFDTDSNAPNLLLSMGMSTDYSQALKYGSNQIRIGSLLFD